MKQFAAIFILLCCLSLMHASPFEFPKFPKFDLSLNIGKWYNPSVLDRKVVKVPAKPGKVQTQTITFESVNRVVAALVAIAQSITQVFDSMPAK